MLLISHAIIHVRESVGRQARSSDFCIMVSKLAKFDEDSHNRFVSYCVHIKMKVTNSGTHRKTHRTTDRQKLNY